MYPYHAVLGQYKEWVQFYIVDARRLPSGRAMVQLTVLVPKGLPWTVVMRLYYDLIECMHQTALHELAADLGYETPSDRDVVFGALIRPEEGAGL